MCLRWFPNYVRAKEVVGTVVVLLAVLLQIDVEVVLREYFNFSNSHVVVRTGDTARAEDLEKISVKDARTVLVMSPADHLGRPQLRALTTCC